MRALKIDEVFDIIGHLGFGQLLYFTVLTLLQIYVSGHMLLSIYIGLDISFSCYFYSADGILKHISNSCVNNSIVECKLEYNGSHSSIVNEWDLVCNKKYKVPMMQSIWMFGVMAGALLLGSAADRFGRLKTLTISILTLIIFEGFAVSSADYNFFVFLRFFAGMSCSITILTSFVLSQELIGVSFRSIGAMIMPVFFALGIGFLSSLAAYFTEWRTLMSVISSYGFFFLILPCFIPESPRWLMGKGRVKEAKAVLELIGRRNRTLHLLPSKWSIAAESESKSQNEGLHNFLSHPHLFMLLLIQIFSWFVNSGVYYALTMAASNVGGNVYWSTTFSGLVEIPAYVATIFIIDKYGRKSAVCVFMVVGGFVCLAIPLLPHYVKLLSLMGKLCISASFAVAYLQSSEIFPTVIRNAAMGILSVAARIGGIAAPFMLMLNDIFPNLLYIVLGAMSFAAGVFNTRLPETRGCPLPETVADVLTSARTPHKKVDATGSKTAKYKKLHQDSLSDEDI